MRSQDAPSKHQPMPPARSSDEQPLDDLRRQAEDLGLVWAESWDRARLNAAIDRAGALKRMQVDELKQRAGALGVQPGEKPRKADWLKAILRAEFPAEPAKLPSQSARPGGAGSWWLRWSGALGMAIIILAMLLTPFGAWRLSQASQAGLKAGGIWAEQTAGTIHQSSEALRAASSALDSSNQALRSVGTSLNDAQPLLSSIGDMLGSQLPDAITTARQSLVNAQSGAQSIDRVLNSLSFFGIGYNPDQPLAQGLAETADSLAPLPQALSDASDHLATTRDDISQVGQDVLQVSDDLANMSSQLGPVADDLEREADRLDKLASSLDLAAGRIGIWIWVGAGVMELLLLIGASTQYAVWLVGRPAGRRTQ